MKITIFIHNYYEDTTFSLYKRVKNIFGLASEVTVMVNIPIGHPRLSLIEQILKKRLPNVYLLKTSNVGKDIGGKLALMHAYLKLDMQSDVLLFIHDKKSPQTVVGESWSEQLFSITNHENVEKILTLFDNKNIGMVGDKNMIFSSKNKSEKELFAGNKDLIFKLASKYNIRSKYFEFVGGTIFWVREAPFRNFFKQNDPLLIRGTLEKGNVLDDLNPTITHSWERLLGWIVTDQGLKIAGV